MADSKLDHSDLNSMTLEELEEEERQLLEARKEMDSKIEVLDAEIKANSEKIENRKRKLAYHQGLFEDPRQTMALYKTIELMRLSGKTQSLFDECARGLEAMLKQLKNEEGIKEIENFRAARAYDQDKKKLMELMESWMPKFLETAKDKRGVDLNQTKIEKAFEEFLDERWAEAAGVEIMTKVAQTHKRTRREHSSDDMVSKQDTNGDVEAGEGDKDTSMEDESSDDNEYMTYLKQPIRGGPEDN